MRDRVGSGTLMQCRHIKRFEESGRRSTTSCGQIASGIKGFAMTYKRSTLNSRFAIMNGYAPFLQVPGTEGVFIFLKISRISKLHSCQARHLPSKLESSLLAIDYFFQILFIFRVYSHEIARKYIVGNEKEIEVFYCRQQVPDWRLQR